MITRVAGALLISLLLVGALCTPVAGQSGCSPIFWGVSGGIGGNPPGSPGWLTSVANWEAQSGLSATCTYTWTGFSWYGECGAYVYRGTGCPVIPASGPSDTGPGPSCPACVGGLPINLTNGNVYIQQTDVKIPGLGNGLGLARTWNSIWPSTQSATSVGLFGPNWRSTYEERIFQGSDGTVKYARADGSFWSFQNYEVSLGYQVVAPANGRATLQYGTTQWILTFENGEQRLFDETSGSLTSIIDRNGNTTQLSYDVTNRLTTVTDPGGQHLYFNYPTNGPNLVTSVTSDFGLSLSYSYDTQGRLIQVTNPDQTTLSFTYNSNSLITAVNDSDGQVLESHTYDSLGRGLTSSRANGVELVTVSYPVQ